MNPINSQKYIDILRKDFFIESRLERINTCSQLLQSQNSDHKSISALVSFSTGIQEYYYTVFIGDNSFSLNILTTY